VILPGVCHSNSTLRHGLAKQHNSSKKLILEKHFKELFFFHYLEHLKINLFNHFSLHQELSLHTGFLLNSGSEKK